MLSILLLTGTAFPCAALLTNDEGAIATSDAQEVILEDREEGVRTHYRVRYDGDADSFGWLIVVHGAAGEGDVGESNEDLFDELRDWTQPRKTSYSFGGGNGGHSTDASGCSCLGASDKANGFGGEFSAGDTASLGGVEVTAEGFAGPYAYRVLDPSDGEALTDWLSTEGFVLGETAGTVAEYVMEGGYSFVAVTLTPDEGETPSEGRTLPPLYIDSDSDTLQFPARMSLTGMAEEQRTTVWVLGDSTAEISSGWSSEVLEYLYSGSDGDAEAAFDAALIEAAARDIPTYLSAYSGVYEDQWVTRFDTLAPRAVHTADPVFTFSGSDDSWQLEIEVPASDDSGESAPSTAWLLLPFVGLGWVRRRSRGPVV